MKSLYLRVWLTVVLVLALFGLGSGWLAQRHVTQERGRLAAQGVERIRAIGELVGQALPEADAPESVQADALRLWAERLRIPLALDDPQGRRLASSPSFERLERLRAEGGPGGPPLALPLDDGRTLWMRRGLRPPPPGVPGPGSASGGPSGFGQAPPGSRPVGPADGAFFGLPPGWLPGPLEGLWSGTGLLGLMAALFVAVALGAYPVVRGLTRRLEALQRGVERFGSGALSHRVEGEGRDEVARLAQSFNRAADRIEALVQSHSRLVANASHELRSPLARLKVALAMLEDTPEGPARDRLRTELRHNLGELDALIEELLLSSRLQAQAGQLPSLPGSFSPTDVLALAVEEGVRVEAEWAHAAAVPPVMGEERLLRRAVRNLLENARRYGGGAPELTVQLEGSQVCLEVADRGPGVPAEFAERIFEPFFRLPGHAESEGGVGLGLALVRQIAHHHRGSVSVQTRSGGGSRFLLRLPVGSAVEEGRVSGAAPTPGSDGESPRP